MGELFPKKKNWSFWTEGFFETRSDSHPNIYSLSIMLSLFNIQWVNENKMIPGWYSEIWIVLENLAKSLEEFLGDFLGRQYKEISKL